jgi:hypothetical protein
MKGFLRYPCAVFAIGIGLCSIAATAYFGLLFAPGPERFIYASIFGFLDASKLVLPSVASFAAENGHRNRARIGVAIYIVLALLSGAAHVGLYATVKSEVLGGAAAAREKYQSALAEKKALESDLAALARVRTESAIEAELARLRFDARYKRSKDCTDVTVTDSRALCSDIVTLEGEKANALQIDRLKKKIEGADSRLRGLDVAAALRSADPQAEQLAALTGASPDQIRLWMAIILSVMIELGSSLLLDVAAVGSREGVIEAPKAGAIEDEGPTTKAEQADASVQEWAKVALQAKRNGSVRCTDAREAFERSVRTTGRTPPAPNAFGRAMTALGYRRKKKGGQFHYVGITLSQQRLQVISG